MKQKTLSEVLAPLIASLVFPIDYITAVNNNDGTYTLTGICDIHHTQPGATVRIGGADFVVADYVASGSKWNIILKEEDGAVLPALPSAPGTFNLYTPYFFHGTPIRKEKELIDTPLDKKTPMIYLMEPYKTELDFSPESAVDRRCNATLCFLTQADVANWLTDDFHHKAINPMYNLLQDFIQGMIDSNQFCTVRQKASPKFHAEFGINIKEAGAKKPIFSQNLSGVSVDIFFEIYMEESCCTTG